MQTLRLTAREPAHRSLLPAAFILLVIVGLLGMHMLTASHEPPAAASPAFTTPADWSSEHGAAAHAPGHVVPHSSTAAAGHDCPACSDDATSGLGRPHPLTFDRERP